MTGSDAAASPPPVAVEPATAGDRASRLSDWLNPIVVREVQQALRGRVFMFSVLAALLVVVAIALFVTVDFEPGSSGQNAFDAGLATLVPLLMFVTPMGAYQSMRHELRGGMVEQLLLSELRPRRIIAGKLTAAMVQFVLYVSVVAPLLAASYLLQGVDLPTVGLSLLLALLFCLTATAFAISAAAQAMLPALQAMAMLGVALGLGSATFGLVIYVASGEYARDVSWLLGSSEFSTVVSLLALGCPLSCVMSGLVAASFLAHAHENKSTGFRVFLFAILAISTGWIAWFVDPVHRSEVTLVAAVALLIGGAVFAIFMVTEQKELSPRVLAHVPRNRLLALFAAPFLPGRHRGLLCFLLFAALLAGLAALDWPPAGRFPAPDDVRRLALFVLGYAVIYLSVGKLVRSRLPATIVGNYVARVAVPLAIFLFCILPFLVDVFARGGVYGWHVGHVLDPFWTIERHAFRSSGEDELVLVLAIAGLLLLIQLPGLVGGVREVLRASAARRARDRQLVAGTEGGDAV